MWAKRIPNRNAARRLLSLVRVADTRCFGDRFGECPTRTPRIDSGWTSHRSPGNRIRCVGDVQICPALGPSRVLNVDAERTDLPLMCGRDRDRALPPRAQLSDPVRSASDRGHIGVVRGPWSSPPPFLWVQRQGVAAGTPLSVVLKNNGSQKLHCSSRRRLPLAFVVPNAM